jgi:hypothetical protein
MGVVATQSCSDGVSIGSIPRRRLGRLAQLAAMACALSSATAWAGLSDLPLKERGSSNLVPAPSSSDSNAPDSIDLKSGSLTEPSSTTATLSTDPITRGLLLSDNRAASHGWSFADPTQTLTNAAPKEGAPPLLIPVPTAVSAGAAGLAILALIGASSRLRRRILA